MPKVASVLGKNPILRHWKWQHSCTHPTSSRQLHSHVIHLPAIHRNNSDIGMPRHATNACIHHPSASACLYRPILLCQPHTAPTIDYTKKIRTTVYFSDQTILSYGDSQTAGDSSSW